MYEFECIHCLEHVGLVDGDPGRDDAAMLRTHLRWCPGVVAPISAATRISALLDHFRVALT